MDHGQRDLTIATPPPIANGGLRALCDYWLALTRQAQGLQALDRFDPMHLPRLLPYIWLIEVDASTCRFRPRLAGEQINAIYGRNIGRKFFAEVFDSRDMDTIFTHYKRALQEPAIFYARGHVYAAAGHYCVGERLGLPMLGVDGGTRILVGATVYGHRVNDHMVLRPAGDEPTFHPIQATNHRAVEIIGG